MREEPVFRKCCRRVPLSVCLHVWAWFKVIADITILLYFAVTMTLYSLSQYHDRVWSLTFVSFLILIPISLAVDFAFVIVLIYAICKKNYTTLRVFFFYGIYMTLAEATIMALILFLPLTRRPLSWTMDMYSIIFLLMGLIWIMLDVLILLTIKSKMIKLRNKEQYDFARMSPNGKAENTETIHLSEETAEKCGNDEKYVKLLD